MHTMCVHDRLRVYDVPTEPRQLENVSRMPPRSRDSRAARDQRISVRVSARQEQLLRHAAAAEDRTMTDLILDSAVQHAERVLADRRWFVVDDEQWAAFQAILDAPLPTKPDNRLVATLNRPSPFAK